LKKTIQKNSRNETYYKEKGKQKYEDRKSAKGGKYKSNDFVEHLPETYIFYKVLILLLLFNRVTLEILETENEKRGLVMYTSQSLLDMKRLVLLLR
jgi:hypothetical protein